MAFTAMVRLTFVLGAAVAAFAENPPVTLPVAAGRFELGTGPLQTANTPSRRRAAVELLTRARKTYALRAGGHGYDLEVSFTVHSTGQTLYDGTWTMEEIFVPHQGRRWTATSAAGFTTTQLFVGKNVYGKGTSGIIPYRLHQVRAALFGPIATPQYVNRDALRTTTSTLNGAPVTCLFLSRPGKGPSVPQGRRWDESEECIDPQTGLLLVHSLAPGTYDYYDYTNGPALGDRRLPRKVTIIEGDKTVVDVEVNSLTEPGSVDPGLFTPDQEMKAANQGLVLGQARKLVVFDSPAPIAPASLIHPVCIAGVITPSGQFVEAHSLQPSDLNSDAALQFAQHMNFTAQPLVDGAPPQQHLGFVIVRFVTTP